MRQSEFKIRKIIAEAKQHNVKLTKYQVVAILRLEHFSEICTNLAELVKNGEVDVSSTRTDGKRPEELNDFGFYRKKDNSNINIEIVKRS